MSPDDNTNSLNNNPVPEPTGLPNQPDNPIGDGEILNDSVAAEPTIPDAPIAPVAEPATPAQPASEPTISETPTIPAAEPTPVTPATEPAATTPVAEPSPVTPPVSPMPNFDAATPAPAPAMPQPKKKVSKFTIILIIIAAVLLAAGVVIFLVVMNNANEQANKNTTPTEEPAPVAEVEYTSLNCAATVTDAELLKDSGGATQYVGTLNVEYADDEMTEIHYDENYTFATAEAATSYIETAKVNYSGLLTQLGVTEDPFDSDFRAKDLVASISHNATSDNLSSENMSVFLLQVDEEGAVDTTKDSIKSVYESIPGANYVCKVETIEE